MSPPALGESRAESDTGDDEIDPGRQSSQARLSPHDAHVTVTVDIHEAKTHLSRLVERAARGEEIVIAKAGRPVARLVPVAQPRQRRQLGWLAGRFTVPDDFD